MLNRRDDDLVTGTNGQAMGIFIQIFVTNLAACFILFWRSYAQDGIILNGNAGYSGMAYFPLIFSAVGLLLSGLAMLFYPRPDQPTRLKYIHALAIWFVPFFGSVFIPVLWGLTLLTDPTQAASRGGYGLPMILKNLLLGGAFGAVMFLLITRLRQQRSLYVYETVIPIQTRTLIFFLALMMAANFIPWYP
jgi:hypothetical protein